MPDRHSPRPSIVDDPAAEWFAARRVLGWEQRGGSVVVMLEGIREPEPASGGDASSDVAELTIGMSGSGAVRLTLGPLDGRDFGILADDLPDPVELDDPTERDDGTLAIRPSEPWEGSTEIRIRPAPFDIQIVGGERDEVILHGEIGEDGHQTTPAETARPPGIDRADAPASRRADPLRWARRTEPDGRVQRAATFTWAREPDERIYGLGGYAGALDRIGRRFTLWSSGTIPLTDRASTPPGRAAAEGSGTRTDGETPAPIPFLVSSRGYGVFVHTPARLTFDLGSEASDTCRLIVEEATLDLFVLPAAWPRGAVAAYADLTGHAPVPPLWAFGIWMSATDCRADDRVAAIATRIRAEAIPCDSLLLERRRATPITLNDAGHALYQHQDDGTPTLDRLRTEGFTLASVRTPYLGASTEAYQVAVERGLLVRAPDGSPVLVGAEDRVDRAPGPGPDHPTDAERQAGLLDVTNPEARTWWQERYRSSLDAGAMACDLGGGASAPAEARFADSGDGIERHNLYALLFQQLVSAATRRAVGADADGDKSEDVPPAGVLWDRTAWAGSQRYAAHLSPVAEGSPAGMAATLREGLSCSLSMPGAWGHDLGGNAANPLGSALYARWAQFSLLSPLARLPVEHGRAPWDIGEHTERIVRAYADLRYRLLPYVLHCARETAQAGLPMLRSLFLEFGWDRQTADIDDQYLLGRDLLVAPVFSDSAEPVARRVYLPAGVTWYDWWTGRPEPGGRWIIQTARLDRLPIFARAGTAIPLADPRPFVGAAPIDVTRLVLFSPRDGAIGASIELADDDIMGVEQARGPKRMKVYAEGLPSTLRDLIIIGVPRDAHLTGASDDRIAVIPDVDGLPGLGGDWQGRTVALVPGALTAGLELGWSSDD
ncbi:MAG: glycoside hydrolase family 31 protein [Chloroflexi bacterium]|nr:glycoside hydrolase family 31 protein [Chloroflexota bacterium]